MAAALAVGSMRGAANHEMASMSSATQMDVRRQNEWGFHAFVAWRSGISRKYLKPAKGRKRR